jgi:Lon protease-like protein
VKILERALPLFPLNTVLFPQARLPLQIFEPRYREMIERCLAEDLAFGILLTEVTLVIKEGVEVGAAALPHAIGTIARIVDVARLADGRMNIIVAGITRFELLERSTDRAYLTGSIRLLSDENVDLKKAERAARRVAQLFQSYANALRKITEMDEDSAKEELQLAKDPTVLSYAIAASLPISLLDKQALLATSTTIQRLQREVAILERELELLRLVSDKSEQIRDQGTFSLN